MGVGGEGGSGDTEIGVVCGFGVGGEGGSGGIDVGAVVVVFGFLSCLVLSCVALRCVALSCHVMPCLALSSTVLSLSHSVLPFCKKITMKVIHLVQRLLAKHPAMKGVVVREVQQYLHRPGLQPKAVYAGIIFLNQVIDWLTD